MAMRTHVEFRSSAFPAYEDEDEQVNPGRFGRRLAEFLQAQLPVQGIPTEEIYAEDWGWAVPVVNQAFSVWVGCGNYEEYPDGFLCFIEPSKPTVRKGLFKKVDTTQVVERVAVALEKALVSRPDVREIRWWSQNETGA